MIDSHKYGFECDKRHFLWCFTHNISIQYFFTYFYLFIFKMHRHQPIPFIPYLHYLQLYFVMWCSVRVHLQPTSGECVGVVMTWWILFCLYAHSLSNDSKPRYILFASYFASFCGYKFPKISKSRVLNIAENLIVQLNQFVCDDLVILCSFLSVIIVAVIKLESIMSKRSSVQNSSDIGHTSAQISSVSSSPRLKVAKTASSSSKIAIMDMNSSIGLFCGVVDTITVFSKQ